MTSIGFNNYQDPGIYVQEIPTPVFASAGITPINICLIGTGQDFQTYTETDQLDIVDSSPAPTTLVQSGINVSTGFTVVDRYTGVTYSEGPDYTLAQSGVAPNTTTTITVVHGGAIYYAPDPPFPPSTTNPSGGWVNISYEYTPPNYYAPYQFNSYDGVTQMYGQPYAADGSINSPLSLAALLAFTNGAPNLTAIAVDPVLGGSAPNNQDWLNTIDSLQSQTNIDVIVPITGIAAVFEYCQLFVTLQQSNGIFLRAFVGHDGVTNPTDVPPITQSFNYQRMTVCSPSVINIQTGVVSGVIPVGGQYIAAATAGLFASQGGTQVPLTWKTLTGFYNIPNQVSQQIQVQQQMNGILVLLQRRNGTIIIKHGLTTDMSNFLTQEISVMSSQDKLYGLIEDTLQVQNIIGSVLNSSTANAVVGAVVTAVNQAITAGLITSYSGLQYQIPVGQPTTVNVRFMYQPSLPLNYIQVQFGIDTTTGSTVFSSTATPFNNSTSTLQGQATASGQ